MANLQEKLDAVLHHGEMVRQRRLTLDTAARLEAAARREWETAVVLYWEAATGLAPGRFVLAKANDGRLRIYEVAKMDLQEYTFASHQPPKWKGWRITRDGARMNGLESVNDDPANVIVLEATNGPAATAEVVRKGLVQP